MLRLLSLVFALLVPLTIIGCGKTEDQKAQEQVDEANAKLRRNDAINKTLWEKGIFIQHRLGLSSKELVTHTRASVERMPDSDLAAIKSLLNEYVANTEFNLELYRSGRAKNDGINEIIKYGGNARAYLKEIEEIQSKRSQKPSSKR